MAGKVVIMNKKINVSELVEGEKYLVTVKNSLFLPAVVTYVGIMSYRGKCPEYWFTYGAVDKWQKQFNIVATKSRLTIKEV